MKIKFALFFFGLSALLSGCIVPSENSHEQRIQSVLRHQNVYQERLAKIKIGMTQIEVTDLIGYPTENKISRNTAGKSEHWIYTGQTLVNHVEGAQAASDY